MTMKKDDDDFPDYDPRLIRVVALLSCLVFWAFAFRAFMGYDFW